MPQTGEARSWWADVEHVREAIESRREAEERARAARAERHLSVVGDHHGGDAHGEGRRAAERYAGEHHTGERRTSERRTSERHTVERRTSERRTSERHTSERHTSERHTSERHTSERHTGERRSGERRAAGPRTAELRAVERRAGERRGAHKARPRRTVEITGRTVPAPALPRQSADLAVAYGARGASRRPSLSPADRLVHRPDRIAMWAVVLGFVLILVAATSA